MWMRKTSACRWTKVFVTLRGNVGSYAQRIAAERAVLRVHAASKPLLGRPVAE